MGRIGRFISATGRLNRAAYVGNTFISFAIGVVFALVLGVTFITLTGSSRINPDTAIMVPFALLFLIQSVKRFHDLNRPGWFLAGLLIPFLNIYLIGLLFLVVGTDGPNTYGQDPLVKE